MAELDNFEEGFEPEGRGAEIHLADYWAIVVKRRRLILACLAFAGVAGVLATVLTKPMYSASTIVDVERPGRNSLPLDLARGEAPAGEFLPSQIQLMKSRQIGERVVKRLNLVADPAFNPKSYQSFRPDQNGQARKPTEEDLIDAALAVQGAVDADIVRGTNLVRIIATASTPKLSADIANAVADSYIDWNVESQSNLIGQSAQFLASQIQQAKAEIDEKEKALMAFGRQKDIVSTDSTASPTMQRLDSVNRDLAGAVADRVAKEARYEEIRNTRPETLADSSSGAVLQTMRSDLQKMERDYADKLNVYKPEWPAMIQLKAQIDDAKKNLAAATRDAANKVIEAAQTDYQTALRREQSLRGMLRSQQSEAIAQGGNTAEYKNLRVEIDTKRSLLDSLLKQQGEMDLASRLREDQLTSVRVVDRALEPGGPFKPSLKRNLLVALFLGGAAGIGLAFLLSYIDRSLRTAEQVERLLQLPALGIVPAESRPSGVGAGARSMWIGDKQTGIGNGGHPIELLPHREPRSPIAEVYRTFRTSLLLSRAGGMKTVVVTSALPKEGKTTTAANLAVVISQLGRRVLIVDADLHQPRMHEVFEIPNRVGLVSILAEGVEPSRAIVKTGIPGVFVVPAGPDAPNPSGLLSSEAMRTFLELAATNFDHVIVDTPPVLPVSDALVFAQQTDGVVLCVRGGKTPRDRVVRARDVLLRSGVLILGVLINGLEPETGYYRRYEYSYGYPREKRSGTEEPAVSPVAHTS